MEPERLLDTTWYKEYKEMGKKNLIRRMEYSGSMVFNWKRCRDTALLNDQKKNEEENTRR